ncbi:CHY-type domain-containing protein [Plasmodiophora brassicae]
MAGHDGGRVSMDAAGEMRYLERVYRHRGFVLRRSEVDGAVDCVAIGFQCTDPEFRQQFGDEFTITLSIRLPSGYPSAAAVVTVNRDDMPPQICRTISQALNTYCERHVGRPMLIGALKWLDRNLVELFRLGNAVVNQEHTRVAGAEPSSSVVHWSSAQQAQLESALARVPKLADVPASERWERIASLVDGKSAQECMERFKQIRDALRREQERKERVQRIRENISEIAVDSGPVADDPLPALPSVDESAPAGSIRVGFSSIQLINVSLVRVRLARFSLQCASCRANVDAELVPTQVKAVTCGKCSSVVTCKFVFEMAHVANARIGSLSLDGAALADYLPSDVWATCANCSADMSVNRLDRHARQELLCHQCHQRMSLVTAEVVFETDERGLGLRQQRVPKRSHVGDASEKRNKGPEQKPATRGALMIGTSLPDFGTCKHYTKSYRWLRFPCCGKAFPCDICHEIGTASAPHEMKWALRQICGFCSRESPVTGKNVCPCGRSVTRARSSFWDGGQGTRDQTTMSRKDSRKHAGASKTTSRKHERVGPKRA